jgi:hypothetical protein
MNSFKTITSALKTFGYDVEKYYEINHLGTQWLIHAESDFHYIRDISGYDLSSIKESGFPCSDLRRLFPEEKVNYCLTTYEYGRFLFTKYESQTTNWVPCALQLECTLDPDLSYYGRELVRMVESRFAEFTYYEHRHCETFDFTFITDTRDLIIITIEVQNYYGPCNDCIIPIRRIRDLNGDQTEDSNGSIDDEI